MSAHPSVPASNTALEAQHNRLLRIFGFVVDQARCGDFIPADAVWDVAVDALERHMADEEALFVRFDHIAEDAPGIVTLRNDHAAIRRALAELGVVVQLHAASPGALGDLLALLRAHAQREEQTLYRWLERLPAEEPEPVSAIAPGVTLGASVGALGGMVAGPLGSLGGAALGAVLGGAAGDILDHVGPETHGRHG